MHNGNIIAVIVALALTGCVSLHPDIDWSYGEAVTATNRAQRLNPLGVRAPESAPGMDGRAAKEAMDRYVDSFKAPPPTMNVINIGGSLAGGQ